MVTVFSVVLIAFMWAVEGIPIANRSPLPSRNVEQSSRGSETSRNTLSTQRLGYHYGYASFSTAAPIDVIRTDPECERNPLISSNAPSGLISVEKSRPVYEITEDEYGPPYSVAVPIKIHSTEQTLVTSPNVKKQKYHHDVPANAVATAITTLDWLLENKGYNSPIHLPPSPVIALVLSHYGRYLPITRGPRVYSYMAANNIHNHQPFGQYKWETEGD